MKKLLIVMAGILLLSLQCFAYSVDKKASKITWTGAKVVGDSHTGHLQIKEADLKWKNGEPTGGQIVIDMTTITNTDVKSEKYNKKLVGHLKSDDFFSVKKHKTATLHIKDIKKKSKNEYAVKADLEIKAQRSPVTFDVKVKRSGNKIETATTKFSFDRTKYGIKYNSGSFFPNLGDKIIKDEVQVAVNLKLNHE